MLTATRPCSWDCKALAGTAASVCSGGLASGFDYESVGRVFESPRALQFTRPFGTNGRNEASLLPVELLFHSSCSFETSTRAAPKPTVLERAYRASNR